MELAPHQEPERQVRLENEVGRVQRVLGDLGRAPLQTTTKPAGWRASSVEAGLRPRTIESQVDCTLVWAEGAGLEPEPTGVGRCDSRSRIPPWDFNPPPRSRR